MPEVIPQKIHPILAMTDQHVDNSLLLTWVTMGISLNPEGFGPQIKYFLDNDPLFQEMILTDIPHGPKEVLRSLFVCKVDGEEFKRFCDKIKAFIKNYPQSLNYLFIKEQRVTYTMELIKYLNL